jgi:hypothetical protein
MRAFSPLLTISFLTSTIDSSTVLGLTLISCLDIASSQSLKASGMDHFDWICTEIFCGLNRHMVLRDHNFVLSHKSVEFLHHFD